MLLRSAAFLAACGLLALAWPAFLRAERAEHEGAGFGRVLYEAGRGGIAVAAGVALLLVLAGRV